MNVLLFGGAFNPITKGHLAVAQKVLAMTGNTFAQLWFLPCYESKWGKQMASYEDRLTMIKLAVNDIHNIAIGWCDFEGKFKASGGSYKI